MHTTRLTAVIPAACATALLAACATTPATTDSLLQAQGAIYQAEQDQAAQFAAFELQSARNKLMAAHQAADAGETKEAQQRAEEASADAELASAKANLSRTLRQGGQPPSSLQMDQR